MKCCKLPPSFIVVTCPVLLFSVSCSVFATPTPVPPTSTPVPQIKIVGVERVKSFGAPGATARARPGYDILLIGIDTKEKLSPLGADLILVDDGGNRYTNMGFFQGKYIFEVPETAKKLTLVVKGTINVPVP